MALRLWARSCLKRPWPVAAEALRNRPLPRPSLVTKDALPLQFTRLSSTAHGVPAFALKQAPAGLASGSPLARCGSIQQRRLASVFCTLSAPHGSVCGVGVWRRAPAACLPAPMRLEQARFITHDTRKWGAANCRRGSSGPQAMDPLGQQRRGIKMPRWFRDIGVPWVVQVFYATMFMVGVAFLVVVVFSASAVFGILALMAFGLIRLFTKNPRMVHSLATRHSQSPAGFLLRPLAEMMSESFLFQGLDEVKGIIENDVVRVINSHRKLQRFGSDFETVGVHQMSLRVVNGEKCVSLQFPVISSVPKELVVEVVARRYETYDDKGGSADSKWEYERVDVKTPEGISLNITADVTKNTKSKRIIDVEGRVKSEDGDRKQRSWR